MEKVALIINGAFNLGLTVNSLNEAISQAKERYKNTFWQEREDTIEIRKLITEPNGYQHVDKTVMFRCQSSKFWVK